MVVGSAGLFNIAAWSVAVADIGVGGWKDMALARVWESSPVIALVVRYCNGERVACTLLDSCIALFAVELV